MTMMTAICAAPAAALPIALESGEVARDDLAIEQAMHEWRSAHGRYRALPIEKPEPGKVYTAAEDREWDIINAAEETIRRSAATTPAGAAAKLWIALSHMLPFRDQEEQILAQDLDALMARDRDFDWDQRLVLAALAALVAMDGSSAGTAWPNMNSARA